MTLESEELASLPIACTLGPADGRQRLEDWRRVVTIAGAGRHIEQGSLTLKFRDVADVGAELHRLVAAERDCCAFLGWNLTRVDGQWQVEITGADDELRALNLAD